MINQILKKYFKTLPANVQIARNLSSNIKEIVTQLELGDSFTIVSDENTYDILGKKVENALSKFKSNSIIINNATACDASVQNIRNEIKSYDLVIAVGSGTINDICKYANNNGHSTTTNEAIGNGSPPVPMDFF